MSNTAQTSTNRRRLLTVVFIVVALLAIGIRLVMLRSEGGPVVTPTADAVRLGAADPDALTGTVLEVRQILPVHRQPSLESVRLGELWPGERVQLTGISPDGLWFQIILGDGQTAWTDSTNDFSVIFGDTQIPVVTLEP